MGRHSDIWGGKLEIVRNTHSDNLIFYVYLRRDDPAKPHHNRKVRLVYDPEDMKDIEAATRLQHRLTEWLNDVAEKLAGLGERDTDPRVQDS